MSSSFVAALRAEVANLQAELSKSLTYQRLLEAQRMLALYEPASPKAEGRKLGDILGEPPYAPAPVVRTSTRSQSPERAKAMEAARLFLANRTDPTPTSAIYDHITSLGFSIGGSDPRNNLSAMLSNSSDFKSNGRAGWTLAPDKVQGATKEAASDLAKLFAPDGAAPDGE